MRNKIVFLFFFTLLVIGLNIFRDYGVHYDEYINQNFGCRWTWYVGSVLHTGSFSKLPKHVYDNGHDLLHGPIFEIFLASLAKLFAWPDPRDIIFMRHLSIFLLFYIGVIFFYLLCLRHFRSWRLALLGCVFLVLSPRIFADAFYNTVDIAFLVFFIISIFTLLLVLDKKTFFSVALHSLACAILINIRLIGLILPIFSLIFFCLEIVRASISKDKATCLKMLVIYVFLVSLLVIFFNPFLWLHPMSNFILLINSAKDFDHLRSDFYLGKHIWMLSKEPWHYAPVWLAVTIPLIYTALFFAGCFDAVRSFFRWAVVPYLINRDTLIFLLWFFLPLMMATGRIYDGWRHIYFIYPAFLIVALMGVRYILRGRIRFYSKNVGKLMRGALIILLGCSFLNTGFFMVRYHPYQNLYFNGLVGRDIGEAKKNFTLDYWGLSYRKALEYILKNDKSRRIPIAVADLSGKFNILILPSEDRRRVVFVPVDKAKYFLTNDMQSPYPSDSYRENYGHEYYSIRVDGMKIMVVYKMDSLNKINFCPIVWRTDMTP